MLTIRLRNQLTVGVGIEPTFDSEVNLRATNKQKILEADLRTKVRFTPKYSYDVPTELMAIHFLSFIEILLRLDS